MTWLDLHPIQISRQLERECFWKISLALPGCPCV